MDEPVGKFLRQFRLQAGLTQQLLAELAGLSVASLRDLEQGRVQRPRPSTLHRLGSALELSRIEFKALLDVGPASGIGTRVEVLGPLRIVVDSVTQEPLSREQRALLGMLALTPNSPLGPDALIDGLWGSKPPAGATGRLQSRISRLRRKLRSLSGASAEVVGTRAGYRLAIDDDHHDLLLFREWVTRARRCREIGELPEAATVFCEALGLWRGDPLGDLPALQSHPEVTLLLHEWRAAVTEYARITNRLGHHEQALPQLRKAAEIDGLDEGVHAALIVALSGNGQQAAALTLFDRVRRRLVQELGADPGPELMAAHERVLRSEVSRPSARPVPAHHQLPPAIPDFSGRRRELQRLREPVADSLPSSTVVWTIEGMAGVGKTRLAVHAAHQFLSMGRYKDFQLYADLRGHAEDPPADANSVLGSFLRLLGMPGDRVPDGLDERAALYRDQLFAKSGLVLLDNASTEDQLRPLLPAGPSLVLITSRRALALDEASSLSLDPFTHRDATDMLAQAVGHARVEEEPVSVDHVIELCERLPAALSLVARRMQSHRRWSFADVARQLSDSHDRVAELAAGTRKLRQVLDLSYRCLCPEERTTFRLIGLHPTNDITVSSSAALTNHTPTTTRTMLDRLADEHLIKRVTAERYRLHGLLGVYAKTAAVHEEPTHRRREATRRLLDHYLHTTATAIRTLAFHPTAVPLRVTSIPPTHGPQLETRHAAEAWLEDEHTSVVRSVALAAAEGFPSYAWQLANALWSYLALTMRYEDWVHTHEIGLAAATALNDHFGQTVMLTRIGQVRALQGEHAEARDRLNDSLTLRGNPDPELEIETLSWLGHVHYRTGDHSKAVSCIRASMRRAASLLVHRVVRLDSREEPIVAAHRKLERALSGYQRARETGDLAHEVHALGDLAAAYRELNLPYAAIAWGERAVATATECRLPEVQTYVSDSMKVAHQS